MAISPAMTIAAAVSRIMATDIRKPNIFLICRVYMTKPRYTICIGASSVLVRIFGWSRYEVVLDPRDTNFVRVYASFQNFGLGDDFVQ